VSSRNVDLLARIEVELQAIRTATNRAFELTAANPQAAANEAVYAYACGISRFAADRVLKMLEEFEP
jgi:hypothetical protein